MEAGRAAPDGDCAIGIAPTFFKDDNIVTSVAYDRVVPRGHTQATNERLEARRSGELAAMSVDLVEGRNSC